MSDLEYQSKAIPTEYKGTLFDSRLEARWAAFLDRLEVDWSYHPLDLDGWFPDFLLTFPAVEYSNGNGERAFTAKREFMVEVKPITEFHAPTAERMRAAHQEAMILLGTRPAPNEEDDLLRIGWWVDDSPNHAGEIEGDEVIMGTCSTCDQISPCSAVHSYHCRRCDSNPGFPVEAPQGWQRLWAEAGNVTKYRPRGRA